MTRKLLIAAFITTPLIVFNGVLPIYLQGLLSAQGVLNMGVAIGTFAFFIWFVNIVLVSKLSNAKNWQHYCISFAIVASVSFPFRSLARDVFPVEANFIVNSAYPTINAFVFNAIVWVIIELVRSGEQKKQAQATIDKLKIENLEAQKQSLIRQIHPHFLFNALSTLKSLIAENQKDAEAYTVRLSKFLRYSFASELTNLTPIEQELEFVQYYIDLQAIRFEDAFTYEIKIPNEVKSYSVPVMALQTLVENIFKHNYFSEKRPLHFSIKYAEDHLTIWNEKVGLKITERNNTGLVNLNRRYELTNGSTISITDTENAFSVTIPLIK